MTPAEEIQKLRTERELLTSQASQSEKQLKTLQSIVRATPSFPRAVVHTSLIALAIVAYVLWRKG